MDTSRKRPRKRFHEHNAPFDQLIERLTSELTVGAIMVPWPDVAFVEADGNCREAREAAVSLMNRHHYSGVPMVCNGRVIGAYKRKRHDCQPNFLRLDGRMSVDVDCNPLDLLRLMRDRDRVIMVVGSHDEPVGWVTYADFSKRPFRLLMFTLVAEIEYLLARALDLTCPGDSWVEVLEGEYQEDMQRRREEAVAWDSVMPLTTFAHIGELVVAAQNLPEVLDRLGVEQPEHLRFLPDFRNRVAHVVRPILPGAGQIDRFADDVERILEWVEQWPQRLEETPPQT